MVLRESQGWPGTFGRQTRGTEERRWADGLKMGAGTQGQRQGLTSRQHKPREREGPGADETGCLHATPEAGARLPSIVPFAAQLYSPTQGQHGALKVVAADKVPGAAEVCWHGREVGSQSLKVTGSAALHCQWDGGGAGTRLRGRPSWERWEPPAGWPSQLPFSTPAPPCLGNPCFLETPSCHLTLNTSEPKVRLRSAYTPHCRRLKERFRLMALNSESTTTDSICTIPRQQHRCPSK